MKWKQLSGQERYRVVELARKGEVPIKELCENFGVTRQTLYRAMEKVDLAAAEVLEPKTPGRKKKPARELELAAEKKEKAELKAELDRWKQKYEIAKTFLDIQRKLESGQPLPGEQPPAGKKRSRRKRERKAARKKRPSGRGTTRGMGGRADGGSNGHNGRGASPVDG